MSGRARRKAPLGVTDMEALQRFFFFCLTNRIKPLLFSVEFSFCFFFFLLLKK